MTEQNEEIPRSRDHLVKVFDEGVPVYKSADASRSNWRAGCTEWYNFRIKKLSAPDPTAEERLAALEQEVKTLKAIVRRMSCLTGIYG